MQLVFCCHLFVFKMLGFDHPISPRLLPQFAKSSNNCLVSFSWVVLHVWEELPISFQVSHWTASSLVLFKTKQKKKQTPTKQNPKCMLLDYLSSSPKLSHYHSCSKLIQGVDVSCLYAWIVSFLRWKHLGFYFVYTFSLCERILTLPVVLLQFVVVIIKVDFK